MLTRSRCVQPITPFALSAYLDSLKVEGYTILLVREHFAILLICESCMLHKRSMSGFASAVEHPSRIQTTCACISQLAQHGVHYT